jgi:hypothetical protein
VAGVRAWPGDLPAVLALRCVPSPLAQRGPQALDVSAQAGQLRPQLADLL